MSKYSSLLLWCLIIATLHCSTLHAGRTSGRSSGYSQRRGGGYFMDQPSSVTGPEQSAKEYLDSKSGLSMFAIISIIFAAIVCCLIFYYGIMCYPFLCRDEKKYRFMDVSSTITAATSSSIQSMEILPADQKH